MSNSPENRYARQVQFAPIGAEGQRRILESSVAVVGCGALGTVAAEILARSGVGALRLVDRDVVEWTNLQRQSLYDERNAVAADSKADAAARRLSQINSTIEVVPIVVDLTPDNIQATLGDVDLVIDASDNFAVRFLLNDWSLSTTTPWVHGGCVGATGQVRLFHGSGKPCFRCLVPEPPPAASVQTCDTAGVVGSATHLIASLQATEAIKWLSGDRGAIRDELLSIDLWSNRIREVRLDGLSGGSCPACADGRFEFLDGSRAMSDRATLICGRDAVQISGETDRKLDLAQAAARWGNLGRVQTTPFFVRLHLDDQTLTLFRDGRAVIEGTTDISEARVLYDRFVGG